MNQDMTMECISEAEMLEIVGGTGVLEAVLVLLAGIGAYQGAKEIGKDVGDWLANQVNPPTNLQVIEMNDYYSNMPPGVQ